MGRGGLDSLVELVFPAPFACSVHSIPSRDREGALAVVIDDREAVHWNHVANLLSTTSGDSYVAFALPYRFPIHDSFLALSGGTAFALQPQNAFENGVEVYRMPHHARRRRSGNVSRRNQMYDLPCQRQNR